MGYSDRHDRSRKGRGSSSAIRARARAQAWRQVDLARHLSRRAVRRARIESLVLLPLLAATLVTYGDRRHLFPHSWDTPIRVVTALAVVSLGWQLARDIGRRCSGAWSPARPALRAS
jgi:hypothetical protein